MKARVTTRELMEIMVDDFLFDNAEELGDMILDGKPYIDEDGYWTQDAHDAERDYVLVDEYGDGNVYIHAIG